MNEVFYRVSKEEISEIYEFHYLYAKDKRTLYIWQWEYFDLNPASSILLAVKVNNKIVATQGMIAIYLRFGCKIVLSGKNESLLIDSEYRGKGLSTRLYSYAVEEYAKVNISCLWGFSRKALIPLSKAGFVVYKDVVKRMVLLTSYRQSIHLLHKQHSLSLTHLLIRMAILPATIYSNLVIRFRRMISSTISKNYIIQETIRTPDDISLLYSRIVIEHPNLIYIDQNASYFNWRILRSPHPIKTYFLYERNELKAYLYLKVCDKYCEITDFTFVEKAYGKNLLLFVSKEILTRNYGFVYYTGNNSNRLSRKVFDLLFTFGFLKINGPNHFVLRNFTFTDVKELFEIRNWYFNDLWSEGI